MALSGAQIAKLRSPRQRMECRFVSFDTITAPIVGAVATGTYTFLDMINAYPRYSWVANSATIVIDANESLERVGKAYATGHVFTKDSGDGTVTDNANGTCDYTAPGAGTGICKINVATDGNAPGATISVAYGDLNLNIGEVTSFSASLSSGSWELTVKARGDASGLDRQTGILLVVNDYWNGAEDTFGGWLWADGVFFGWVDRVRTIYQDSEEAYAEIRIVGARDILNKGSTPDAFFSKADVTAIYAADFEAIDAAWIFIQESGINDQINCWFLDDGQEVTNLKLEEGPFSDVIADIVGRVFGLMTTTKQGDIVLQGDPDIRLSEVFNQVQEFTVDEDMLSSVSFSFQEITDVNTPVDPDFKQITLEAVDGSLDNLIEHWPAVLVDGPRTSQTGLICEDQPTLATWAELYWWKVNKELEADLGFFLMHHVEILTLLGWSVEIRAADLSNYDWAKTFTGVYVTDIDYSIDPGMGLWSGQVHVMSYYDPGS